MLNNASHGYCKIKKINKKENITNDTGRIYS